MSAGCGHDKFTIHVGRPKNEVIALIHDTDGFVPFLFRPGMSGVRRTAGANSTPGAIYGGERQYTFTSGSYSGYSGSHSHSGSYSESSKSRALTEKFWINALTDSGITFSYENTEHTADEYGGCCKIPPSDTVELECTSTGPNSTVVHWLAPRKYQYEDNCLVILGILSCGVSSCVNACEESNFNEVRRAQCEKIKNYLTRTAVPVGISLSGTIQRTSQGTPAVNDSLMNTPSVQKPVHQSSKSLHDSTNSTTNSSSVTEFPILAIDRSNQPMSSYIDANSTPKASFQSASDAKMDTGSIENNDITQIVVESPVKTNPTSTRSDISALSSSTSSIAVKKKKDKKKKKKKKKSKDIIDTQSTASSTVSSETGTSEKKKKKKKKKKANKVLESATVEERLKNLERVSHMLSKTELENKRKEILDDL